MTGNFGSVIEQLEVALGNEKFPAELHQWGTQLVSHLRKPVQVAVIGLPGSGKSALINMMLGQQVIPRLDGVSVIEVAGGTSVRSMFETEDGSIIRLNGLLADTPAPPGTIRARQEMPDQDLDTQNYVEVNLPGEFGHQKSIVNWTTQWADIILWCTERFDQSEQKLWQDVPEETKDHSLLILTKADQQLMRGVLADRISGLEDIVAEEFLGLYPVATLQAAASRDVDAQFNPRLWDSSGGKELHECVQRQVQAGRSADLDQAQMLLNQLPPGQRAAASASKAETASPAPKATTPEPQADGKQITDGDWHNVDPQKERAFGEAIQLLQNCADDMLGKLSPFEDPDPDKVLDQCVETANALAEILGDASSMDPSVKVVQDDVLETSEMMMLLRLEKGEDAAADAVTLLLQMKKEIAGHSAI